MKSNELKNWIVLANAHHAKIFARTGKKNSPVFTFISQLEAELDTVHEKPGRTKDRVGSNHHAIEPHTDRRDVEHQKFARQIYDVVKNAEKEKQFTGLILVASSHMLECINDVFDDELQKKVKDKLMKNIVDFSEKEVKEYLSSSAL